MVAQAGVIETARNESRTRAVTLHAEVHPVAFVRLENMLSAGEKESYEEERDRESPAVQSFKQRRRESSTKIGLGMKSRVG
jgi:hypothetical protein